MPRALSHSNPHRPAASAKHGCAACDGAFREMGHRVEPLTLDPGAMLGKYVRVIDGLSRFYGISDERSREPSNSLYCRDEPSRRKAVNARTQAWIIRNPSSCEPVLNCWPS